MMIFPKNLRIEVGTAAAPSALVFGTLAAYQLFQVSPRLMTFGFLYVNGHVHVAGDWFAAARFVHELSDHGGGLVPWALQFFARTQTVATHYGWSAAAFAEFLDRPYMQYTCGRLEAGHAAVTLEEAQSNKLASIARLLKVRPGQVHLDVGCGWGGLLSYFTQKHGTISHGVTLAPEQAAYARQLAPRAEVFISRFEEFAPQGAYDVATVVGMLEHVPVAAHAAFFVRLARMVRSEGRVYVQCITRSERRVGDRTRFLKQYVFAHELSSIEQISRCAADAGFRVVHTEEAHLDYAFTLREWVTRLRAREGEICAVLDDDRTYRILLGYLTMGMYSFADGHSNLHRILLVKE